MFVFALNFMKGLTIMIVNFTTVPSTVLEEEYCLARIVLLK